MGKSDVELDVTGVCCPMPIIRITQVIQGMGAGQSLTVSGNDPMFESSVRDYCRSNGHQLIAVENGTDRRVTMTIRIGGTE